MSKKIAIITAGGMGTRMGVSQPKQFLLLNNKPILWYTLHAFLEAFDDISIILVLPSDYINQGKNLVAELKKEDAVTVIEGGHTRFHSVKNGIHLVDKEAIVFVHDGVRCLITPALIRACYEQAKRQGSAIPAVSATDSIRIIDAQSGHSSIDRNRVKIIQTPQTFRGDLLIRAFELPYQEIFTDEATVVEYSGEKVYLIEGDYDNLKITRPVDLLLAATILQNRSNH